MKKAIIVGGSNGVGLSIAIQLIKNDYFVIIIDKTEPEQGTLSEGNFLYLKSNLLFFQEDLFKELALDPNVSFLMITAGFGRIAKFENIDLFEIKNQMQVNAVSVMEIIKCFSIYCNKRNTTSCTFF